MSVYKLLGILSACVIIIIGAVYLKVGSSLLSPTLLISAAAILAMGVFQALDLRSRGEKGIASLIPAICLFVLAFAVFALWIYVTVTK